MRFYTTTTNSRGNERGMGAHRNQVTHARGWDQGIKVISTLMQDGSEQLDVYVTGGTNNPTARRKIGFLRDGVWHESGK